MSYVITTRNKFPMLREVMGRLAANRRFDEEIIAIDAGSSDGTAEYLAGLNRDGHIQQFVSESDRGEAHGYNKGLLLAQGDLIKVITDDDVFDFKGIASCREYMRSHPEVDAVGSTVGHTILERPDLIVEVTAYRDDFDRWQRGEIASFRFCGLPLMIRRRQLPLAGLFHTGCVQVDFEYTLRITRVLNLAWWTGVLAVRIDNPGSNFRRLRQQCEAELERISRFHGWVEPPAAAHPSPAPWVLWRRRFGAWRRRLLPGGRQPSPTAEEIRPVITPAEMFLRCEDWLERQSAGRTAEFLTRPSEAGRGL